MESGTKIEVAAGGANVGFICPGCNEAHYIRVSGQGRPMWSYNGNPDAPTFKPSILRRTGHYASGFVPGHGCWCGKDSAGDDWTFECSVCHSFVTDGKIQFLDDCTHALAGQTVDLPDFKEP